MRRTSLAVVTGVFVALWAAFCPAGPEQDREVHIVHFGDSVTRAKYLPPEQRVDAVMQQRLRRLYGNERIVCHNVSKGGATVERFMQPGGTHETKGPAQIDHADVCFIMFGVNDEDKYGPEEFKQKLAAMCDRVERDYPGVKIFLCTSVRTKNPFWWGQKEPDAEEPISKAHYAKTRELAAERGYPLVDVYKIMVKRMKMRDWDMFIRNQKLSQEHYGQLIVDDSKDAERRADGEEWFKEVHPNAHGVKCIADAEIDALREAYPERLPVAGPAGGLPIRDGTTWVFFGDAPPTQRLYASYVEAYAQLRFPKWRLRFRKAGGTAEDAEELLERFEREAPIWRPDVVSVLLSPKIASDPDSYKALLGTLAGRIRSVQATPILISPLPSESAEDRSLTAACAEAAAALGKAEQITCADVHEQLAAVYRGHSYATQPIDIPPKNMHVSETPAGQLVIACAILKSLGAPGRVSEAAIDAEQRERPAANGCEIAEITKADGGLTFTRLDQRLPMPIGDRAIAAADLSDDVLRMNRYILKVTNLREGSYRLLIDEHSAGRMTSQDLADGWNMATAWKGPIVEQLDEVLYRIRRKDGRADQPGTVAGLLAQIEKIDRDSPISADAFEEEFSRELRALRTAEERIHDAAQPQQRLFEIVPVPEE